MGKTSFSLLLVLVLLTLRISSQRQCNLSGFWKNDLGSNMTISAVNAAGLFSGEYLTAVSATTKEIVKSPLNGFQHMEDLKNMTFGFTVKWEFSDSTTVFVGQCFVDERGEETLRTMWLLRTKAKAIEDDWNATLVGTNVFTRIEGPSVGESPRSNCNQ